MRAGQGVYAAAADLPKTGQTTCYDAAYNAITCANTGQDGDLQKGTAWPSPRFINPDYTIPVTGGVVLDQLTGLMWTRDPNTPGPSECAPGTGRAWGWALVNHIACLNANNYLGYSDWRMPNINELESLVNAGQSSRPATWLNSNGFNAVQSTYYWSSTTQADWTYDAKIVDMGSGYIGNGHKGYGSAPEGFFVWPVRSMQ